MEHPDMHDVFQLYQSKIALLSSTQRDKLCGANSEGMTPFVIGCAVLRAKQEQRTSHVKGVGKRISFNYVWRIIEDWMAHGIVNEETFKEYWGTLSASAASGLAESRQRRVPNVQNGQRKVTRGDFTYKTPEPPSKGLFSFLDD